MRTIFICELAIAILAVKLVRAANDPIYTSPSAGEIAAAKDAYGKFGAVYEKGFDPNTKHTSHGFSMPPMTTDIDMTGLPDLPFRFFLDFSYTKAGDGGLKQLKELKNLTGLYLCFTQVTDAGIKEIKSVKSLAHLDRVRAHFGVKQLSRNSLVALRVAPLVARL